MVSDTGSAIIGTTATTADAFGGSSHTVSSSKYGTALEQLRTGVQANGRIALYIHLPFCPSRCLSCETHTSVNHDPREIDRYLDALQVEMALVAARLGGRRELGQLHLGGGTPNFLSDSQLLRLVSAVERHFDVVADTRASLEANPLRSSRGQLDLLRGLGFTAISFEVRDTEPTVQRALGRSLSLATLEDAVANARAAGFDQVTIDLVYGLPEQTVATLRETMRGVVSLLPDRIMCHAFAHRAAQFAHQHAITRASLPSLGEKLGMFNAVLESVEGAGYQWIGLHGFVRPDDPLCEAQRKGTLCRDWHGYATESSGTRLGLGVSALSELPGLTTQNFIDAAHWFDALNHGESPVWRGVDVPRERELENAALESLLCNQTLTDHRPQVFAPGGIFERLEARGFVVRQQEKVAVTARGRIELHQLCGALQRNQTWAAAL